MKSWAYLMSLIRRPVWDEKETTVPEAPPKPLACTYCNGTKFYEGPSGGCCVNILCANKDCRHWFNHLGGTDLEDLDRVEPAREPKEA